ncbi:MAG: winged helix-turn-helix domain-containing protein [Pyrinomonadaceae bacterium]|nr:winged helix-turn-helix domain-containing protein [Pyrinomonadaceae bacterium]
MRIAKFSSFLINLNERRLIKNGRFVEIGQKTFDVLQFLIEHRQQLVSKERILHDVWGGAIVEEGNLPVHISKLRKLLGSRKSEPFIETISGSGYIFVEPISEVTAEEWESARPPRTSTSAHASENEKVTVAVLPFVNENGDKNLEYLADGLTENIINELSQIPDLHVLARNTVFEFKNSNTKLSELAEMLDVANILTGRVRLLGKNLTACLELTRVRDSYQIWGTTINEPFTDIFSIQRNIAASVVKSLINRFESERSERESEKGIYEPESYKSYLKGNYFINKKSLEDIERAKEYYIRGMVIDPSNPYVYLGLANVYRLLHSYEKISREESLEQIYPILDRALKLEKRIPELSVFKGIINLFFEYDFDGAKKCYEHAIGLNPNSLSAHFRLAELFVFTRQNSNALTELNFVSSLDPISVRCMKDTAKLLYFMHRFDEAILKLQECAELENPDFETCLLRGLTYAEVGDFEAALSEFHRSLEMQESHTTIAYIGYVHGRSGKFDLAAANLDQISRFSEEIFVDPVNYATIYSGMREHSKALDHLDEAFRIKSTDLVALGCHPIWKDLSSEPRYRELLDKTGIEKIIRHNKKQPSD